MTELWGRRRKRSLRKPTKADMVVLSSDGKTPLDSDQYAKDWAARPKLVQRGMN